MPILSSNEADFIIRVRDDLTQGQDRGARAQVTLAATAVVAGQTLVVKSTNFGTAANAYTCVITLPGGTSGLNVTFTGGVLTIALAVTAGVATVGANTLNLIATAILGLSGSPFIAYPSSTGTGEIRLAASSVPFAGGVAGRDGVASAPRPFLLAQDSANILQILQDKLSKASVTATGGSTTTAVVASVGANDWRGALVTFASNTTTALLRGVTARVLSNTGTTFTFSSTLPAAVVNTDTFAIEHTILDANILELRQGRTGLGDSPAGNVYGTQRIVADAFSKLILTLGGTIFTPTVSWPSAATKTGSTTTEIKVNETYKIDSLAHKVLTISGASRDIVSNTEDTIVVAPALSVAPAGAVAYTVTVPVNTSWDGAHVYPGPHPFNYMLAALITTALTEVVGTTLPA